MRILLIILVFIFVSCKKDGGKHCPDLPPRELPRAELSPVSNVKQIMDTLAKYPELEAFEAHLNWGFDPGSYSANIGCIIYYKNIPFLNTLYFLWYSSYNNESRDTRSIPRNINLDVSPKIDKERAKKLAEEKIHFEDCPLAQLYIYNMSLDTIPDFKLIWRIEDPLLGTPFVHIDALTGASYGGFTRNGQFIE